MQWASGPHRLKNFPIIYMVEKAIAYKQYLAYNRNSQITFHISNVNYNILTCLFHSQHTILIRIAWNEYQDLKPNVNPLES